MKHPYVNRPTHTHTHSLTYTRTLTITLIHIHSHTTHTHNHTHTHTHSHALTLTQSVYAVHGDDCRPLWLYHVEHTNNSTDRLPCPLCLKQTVRSVTAIIIRFKTDMKIYAYLTCTCSHMLIRQQIFRCINYAIPHCTKHGPALPTESNVPLDCFISTQCFRETLPSGENIINYKNSPLVTHKPDML